jgi:hypothetical protein
MEIYMLNGELVVHYRGESIEPLEALRIMGEKLNRLYTLFQSDVDWDIEEWKGFVSMAAMEIKFK